MTMPSGAGHDAQTMQSLCPSALIFVPSRGGISHAPEEWTDWPDIEKGAQPDAGRAGCVDRRLNNATEASPLMQVWTTPCV